MRDLGSKGKAKRSVKSRVPKGAGSRAGGPAAKGVAGRAVGAGKRAGAQSMGGTKGSAGKALGAAGRSKGVAARAGASGKSAMGLSKKKKARKR